VTTFYSVLASIPAQPNSCPEPLIFIPACTRAGRGVLRHDGRRCGVAGGHGFVSASSFRG
jgi:hypothetical protein